MSRLFSALLVFILSHSLAPATLAQEGGRTILVLDASGSMWGQIDGKAKITIAQEVIDGLLNTIPEDQALGLTAYGHRRKGDCSDIESLVAPGSGTRAAISSAVNAIKPKGKTPLSAAVIAAAETLKYTEEKATVILVSDGRETCEFDPCEVGRRLEEAGIDFTAHVIGFDVAKKSDRAQLQCLAENTGGVFRTASNAAELTEALKVVAEPPAPVPVEIAFVAIEGEDGPRLSEGLLWTLTNLDSGKVITDMEQTPGLSLPLLPGRYKAEVLRAENETNAEAEIRVFQNTDTTVTLILPLVLPEATLEAPETAFIGETVSVTWNGPDEAGDYLTTAEADQRDGAYVTYAYTRDGAPLGLRMPPVPGTYEIRYFLDQRGLVIARRSIEVLPVEVSIDIPAIAIAGETLTVNWVGPDYARDYLSTALPEARDALHVTYQYTSAGSPLQLTMPPEPGEYEVRYVMDLGGTAIFRKKITITKASATLMAPDEAVAGSSVVVDWTAPNYDRDYLVIAVPGDRDSKYINYSYTAEGSPTRLLMPAEPGQYEIRYVMNQNSTVLARRSITVTDVTATILAPPAAAIGESVLVNWTGPDYQSDYIAVAEIGARGSKYLGYQYTAEGAPLRIRMPITPGTYEIRYIQSQGSTILARETIEITPLKVSLSVPASGKVGSELLVTWDGPNYQSDYISVAEIGSRDTKYIHYAYTSHGSPLRLQMPAKSGEYVIRYMANASPDTVLASQTIRLEAVSASLNAAATGKAGENLVVAWSGPDYQRDYIAIAAKGADRYTTYAYTQQGSPLRINLPDQPGEYEIWYVMSEGDTVLERQPLTVE